MRLLLSLLMLRLRLLLPRRCLLLRLLVSLLCDDCTHMASRSVPRAAVPPNLCTESVWGS